jgi:hypothetical protein
VFSGVVRVGIHVPYHHSYFRDLTDFVLPNRVVFQ